MTEPLSLPPEDLRRLGYRIIDALVEHSTGVRDLPPAGALSIEEALGIVGEPPPAGPGDPDAALEVALVALRDHMHHLDHPRYFARVPGPSNTVGVLGAMLTSAFNGVAMSSAGSPGPTAIEVTVLGWLAEALGLPAETEGILLSGGSVSSLAAFATARRALLGGHDPQAVVYLSDQTHTSIARAFRVLGFAPDRIRTLDSDDGFRLTARALAAAVHADRGAGLRPFLAVATAGSTNTGAIDELSGLADVARAHDMWLHVDGAYGAPAALTGRGRALLAGVERADSVALDPHKWLFAPYEAGALLVRHPGALERTFAVDAEYLRDLGGEVNFRDRGPQLTRGTRAIKLWLALKTFGFDAVGAAIARGIELAELAERTLRGTPGWEIVTPARLAIVCFAHERTDAAELVRRMAADGYAAPSSTVLRDRRVLRLCTINPRTTDGEIVATVERMIAVARA